MIPEELFKAGEVAKAVKEEVYRLVRPGASVYELAERVERIIAEKGARPAFPCNVSIGHVAAHYTPSPGDSSTIPAGSVVKVDIGVEVDGYIADTAVTVADSPVGEALRNAAEEALKAALRVIRDGVKASEVGNVVYSVASRYGFKPIRNLTGHEVARYNLHAGVSIPNVPSMNSSRLLKGRTYAIEPFITLREGAGEVVESGEVTIFRYEHRPKALKGVSAKEAELLNLLAQRFKGLPHSTRWIADMGGEYLALHERLVKTGRIHGYPVLVERLGKPVAQAEHTIVVESDGVVVLT